MNTKLFKYIIAFVLTFLALPMMAQDYMTIYFKDGTNRMFYLEDVSEITTSKFDADGAFHNDYDFQYVITQQKKYVYALNDVDSITFTKFDEEIVEKNLSSVMTTLSPILGKSNSIDDIKENINSIKESEGVEDAWCSNNDLFVKVEGWETMAFHMNHEREFDLNDVNKTRIVENIKETFARINTLVKSDGSKIKVVIANQQHNDESGIRFFYREKLFIPIVSELNENNISATYVDNPDLDFFSSDIYDYDVVFLITHGGYNQQSGIHSFITSDELGTATFEPEQDPSEFRQQLWRERLWWYRRKDQFKGATNQHFYLNWVEEIREGKKLWVAYPCVTEQFFIDYSRGVFPSSNSVLFNGACQTLMGNDGNASFNMAEVFRRHNLGVYVGYTHYNCLGQVCGTTFLSHLLKGNSIVKSFNDLKNATFNYTTKIGDSNLEMPSLKGNYHQEENIDYNEDGSIKTYFTAELKMYPEKTEVANPLFLFPTVTVEKSQDNINKDYSQGGVVVLEGITSFYDISKDNLIREEMNITDNTHHEIKYGFEYGTNEYIQNWKIDANISSMSYDSESGNCLFKATLKNLEPGKYYYRAYTYDGLVYNYGKRCSFEISHIVNLAVGDVFTVDDVVYKVTSISPLEVQIGSGMQYIPAIDQSTSGAFEVPSTVKGTDGNIYSVTSIGENAFMWCKGLISIYIGNNVKSIGDYAFCYCDGLKSIIIPNSVTSIGEGAFYGSKGITSVTIPNSVTFIGDKTFFECDNLKSIVIPNSVTYIGEETFRGCESLTTVTIGNKVTSIGKCAFQECTGLTTVGLGNSVTSIGDFAFYGCNSLTSVNIPSSVTTIGFFAFLNCGSLTSIKIPKSVTSIGDGAFRYCSSLAKIYADATIPLEVDYWLFEGVDVDNCVLYVPKGCVNKYRWATGWEVFKNIVEME